MHADESDRATPPRPSQVTAGGRALASVPPSALVLVGIFSVQLGAALAKHLFETVGSSGAVALRLTFATLVLVGLWRPSLRMSRRAWRVVIAYGAILGVMNLSFYLALARIPLGIAVTIEFLGPLAVALAGSRRWLDVLWVVMAGSGVALLAQERGGVDLVGLLLALAAGVCWGLYIVVGTALGRHTRQGNGLALGMAVATAVVVPFGVGVGGAALLQPGILAAGFGVALLSSVIPYSLELEALRKMPPRVFGILMSLEPAMAALIGLVVLHETLGLSQWVAVFCVVAASAGAARGGQPEV